MLADPASEPSPDHPQTYQPNVDNGKLGGRSVCHSRAMTRSGRVHCPSKSNSTTTVKALKRSKIQMAQQDTDQHSDQHTPFMVQQEPGLSREISQEDVSDGLSFCRCGGVAPLVPLKQCVHPATISEDQRVKVAVIQLTYM